MTVRRSWIDRAGIAGARPDFVWDEWNVKSTYTPPDDGEVARLATLSKRANCGFTIAIGEWILARFEGMDADREPADFLQAAWAANVDLRYADEIVIVDDEWRGPVRGPISMALTFVSDALFAEEAGPNSALNPAWAARFARHVLPHRDGFDAWFAACLARLESGFPAPADEDLDWFDDDANRGTVVPIEVFDPEFVWHPELAAELIDRFLGTLAPQRNPFLRTPAEMLDDGFRGTPYRLR